MNSTDFISTFTKKKIKLYMSEVVCLYGENVNDFRLSDKFDNRYVIIP